MTRSAKIGLLLAVLVLAAFLAVPLLGWLTTGVTVHQSYSFFVSHVSALSGLNSYLIHALAALWVLPAAYGIKSVLRPEIRLGKVPWWEKRRNRGIAMLVAQVVVWNGAMYFLTRDQTFAFETGAPLKWYAITPSGVVYFDRAGVDPVYGQRLQPVTPEIAAQLKLLQSGDFSPRDPEKLVFFNPFDGKPQVWYYKRDDGAYEFYDKPGFHPRSGAALHAVTAQVVADWRSSLDAGRRRNNEHDGEAAVLPPARRRTATAGSPPQIQTANAVTSDRTPAPPKENQSPTTPVTIDSGEYDGIVKACGRSGGPLWAGKLCLLLDTGDLIQARFDNRSEVFVPGTSYPVYDALRAGDRVRVWITDQHVEKVQVTRAAVPE